MTRLADPERVGALLAEVADAVILPRFRNLQASEISDKGGGDLVTHADQEAEDRLTRALADLVPGSVVVGEEAVAADASIVSRISGDAPVWIIDPLDGTNNFARGSELFAVMVALAVRGRAVLGAIHLPTRGVTALAEPGAGAFLNGQRLRSAAAASPDALRGSVHTKYLPEPLRTMARSAVSEFASNEEIYCCGQVYVALAEGRIDAALYWRTNPWDHAMGDLILAEAGGMIAYPDRSRYDPTVQNRKGLIAASGPETWALLREKLFGSEAPSGRPRL